MTLCKTIQHYTTLYYTIDDYYTRLYKTKQDYIQRYTRLYDSIRHYMSFQSYCICLEMRKNSEFKVF